MRPPQLEQSAIEPIPEQICRYCFAARIASIHRHADADVEKDVLENAEADLHLGYEIPLGSTARTQILGGKYLHDRRPGPSPATLLDHLADRRSPIHRVRRE